MSHYVNGCSCERCRTRGFMAPAILITLGALFLIGEFTRFGFGDTWPFLLIVIGVVKVLQSHASTQGHVTGYVAYPNYPVAPAGQPGTTTPATPDQGQVSHG